MSLRRLQRLIWRRRDYRGWKAKSPLGGEGEDRLYASSAGAFHQERTGDCEDAGVEEGFS